MSNLPQQNTINQYVADGVTTVYTYSFLILEADASANDVAVYVTPSGQTANPAADIQVLNEDYTVQNVGNVSGGTITFLTGSVPANGAIVTIVRAMAFTIDTEFALAQNFNGANLDSAFERVVLMMQQLNTYYLNNALSYIINSYLPTTGSNFLPPLTTANGQIWMSQGDKVIAVVLEQNPDVSTLRSELASETEGADGASLIGYYDEVNNVPTTVAEYLNSAPRPPNNNVIIGGDMTTNPFQRGTSFTAATNGQYLADRFQYNCVGVGTIDSSQAVDSPTVAESGFFGTNCLKLQVNTPDTVLAATDHYGLSYVIEGYDWTYLAQRPFTLSFWVKGNLPGIYCVAFQNSGADRSYVAQFSISASMVWEYVTVTVSASPAGGTWNYTNGIGCRVHFTLGIGTNFVTTANAWNNGNYLGTTSQTNAMSSNTNYFQIDRVKIEPGLLATTWQPRLREIEQALCERYYQKSYDVGDAPGTVTLNGATLGALAESYPNGNAIINQPLRTRMRAAPTVHAYSRSTGTIDKARDETSSADYTVSYLAQSQCSFAVVNSSGGALAATHQNSFQWIADADF